MYFNLLFIYVFFHPSCRFFFMDEHYENILGQAYSRFHTWVFPNKHFVINVVLLFWSDHALLSKWVSTLTVEEKCEITLLNKQILCVLLIEPKHVWVVRAFTWLERGVRQRLPLSLQGGNWCLAALSNQVDARTWHTLRGLLLFYQTCYFQAHSPISTNILHILRVIYVSKFADISLVRGGCIQIEAFGNIFLQSELKLISNMLWNIYKMRASTFLFIHCFDNKISWKWCLCCHRTQFRIFFQ